MYRALCGLLVVGVLAGCAGAPPGPGSGPRPARAEDLLGRWYPADGTAQGRAFVEFAADGSWRGSDGCNGQSGTWQLGPDGVLTGTAGPSTLIACENVPVAAWIADGGPAGIDHGALVIGPARMVRDLPG